MKYKVLKETMKELTTKAERETNTACTETHEGNLVKAEYHKGMSAGLRFAVAILNDRKGL